MAWNPQDQIEELAKKKLSHRMGLRKELRTLPSHLAEGEDVLNMSNGMYDGVQGLIVLTDRRVIFISAGMTKSRFEDFPYGRISSVQHSGGMMFGELVIFTSGNKAELKQMIKDRAKEIGDYIRDRIHAQTDAQAPTTPEAAPTPGQSADDPFEKLRKLGELRDAGVITDEDFEAKKQQLLAEM